MFAREKLDYTAIPLPDHVALDDERKSSIPAAEMMNG